VADNKVFMKRNQQCFMD